jgi:hypothetical protein
MTQRDERVRGEAAARLLEAAAKAGYHAQPGSQVLAEASRVRLTTIGSRGELEVTPAALPEAAGGVTLWFRWDVGGETAITFTEDEAKRLVVAVSATLSSELFR